MIAMDGLTTWLRNSNSLFWYRLPCLFTFSPVVGRMSNELFFTRLPVSQEYFRSPRNAAILTMANCHYIFYGMRG